MKPVVKKALVGGAAVVGVSVVALVVAFATLNPQALIQQKKDELLQQVSTSIGRQLTSGTVTARVGFDLGATVSDIKLAGPPSSSQPAPDQLSIQQVDMQFSLLRALVSFGKDLYVERFVVDGLVLRAARDADGRWDFQDIIDASSSEPAAPETPSDSTALDGLRIASVMVRNGRIELNDAMVGRPLVVDALNVSVSDVEIGKPLTVAVTAALVDGQKKSAVDVATTLATLPKGFSFDPMPDVTVKAALTDVDLGPWGGMLPVDSPAPVGGTLSTTLTTTLKNNLAVVDVAGTVFARQLVLRDALGATATKADRALAKKGTPLDVDVTLDVHVDGDTTEVKKLTIAGSGAAVDASLKVSGGGLAGLQQAAVTAKVDDLSRFLKALPPSLRGLPEEVEVDGPLQASLTKSGGALGASLNLDTARVRYVSTDDAGVTSPSFDKAAGKALHLSLAGKDAGKSLDISEFALVVDTVKLGGTISVPMDDGVPMRADVHSGAVSLASLQGLVPPFREAIGRGQKVEGTLQIDVTASANGDKQLADVAVLLKGLDINLASTIVKGDGGVTIKAAPGADDVGIVAVADFDRLQVKAMGDDGTASLDKPAGLPLRLDIDVKKAATSATINAVKLVIGKSSIAGKGTVVDIGGKGERLALDFGNVDLAFSDLRQAIPGASSLPAGGRVRGAVSLRGGLSSSTMGLDIKNLDMGFGSSVVKGTIGVDNLSAPRVDVDLPTLNLAFNDLRGLAASMADLPADGRFDGGMTIKGDTEKLSTMTVDVKITRFAAAKSDLKGSITIKNLDAPQFQMQTQSDFLDVDALRAAFGGGDDDESTAPKKDENPHGLGKATRDMLAGVNGKATMKASRALMKGMKLSDFTGVLSMTRGVARFDTLEFGFYGGRVSATGTTLGLPAERTNYDLRLEGENVDFGAFLADQTSLGKLFKGTVSPKVSIKGRGLAAGDFAITADGPASLSFKELVIGGLDVLGPLDEAMKKALGGKSGGFNAASASSSGKERGLVLNNFTALTKFIGGKLKLDKPIEASTPMGKMKIDGTAGLDNRLDFTSVLQLSPATVSKMTNGKVKPKSDIPLPFRIGGTWDAPKVTGFDVGALLKAIVGDQAAAIVDKGKDAVEDVIKDKGGKGAKDVKDKATDAAKDAIGGLLGGSKKKKKK